MSDNYRLRAAITKAGLLPEDLADEIGVDPKSVGRWLEGRVPHPRHRLRVAEIVRVDEEELWPDAQPTAAPEAQPLREIVGAYPHSADRSMPDWRELLDASTEQIDLLHQTLLGIIDQPGFIEHIAARAATGVPVRVLVMDIHKEAARMLNPRNITEPQREREQQILHAYQRTAEHLDRLHAQPGVDVRAFVPQFLNSLLRFDQEMLLLLHVYGERDAPVLHLRRRQDEGLFDRYAEHYQRTWDDAEPYRPATDLPQRVAQPAPEPERDRAPTAEEAQQALERLRGRP